MKSVWKILDTKRKPNTGLVIEVVYAINCSVEDKLDRHVGIIKLEGDASSPSFVSFDRLKEDDVIKWVKDSLGNDKINIILLEIETRLLERINKEKNPDVLNGLPWIK